MVEPWVAVRDLFLPVCFLVESALVFDNGTFFSHVSDSSGRNFLSSDTFEIAEDKKRKRNPDLFLTTKKLEDELLKVARR